MPLHDGRVRLDARQSGAAQAAPGAAAAVGAPPGGACAAPALGGVLDGLLLAPQAALKVVRAPKVRVEARAQPRREHRAEAQQQLAPPAVDECVDECGGDGDGGGDGGGEDRGESPRTELFPQLAQSCVCGDPPRILVSHQHLSG